MRPPRILIAGFSFVAFVFLTFVSLRSSHSHRNSATSAPAVPRSGIQSLFSFRAPFSLFPPNAIITLTNDNTTAFLARPAQYGPPLPSNGLKGQVWIGSGFGDDNVRQGTVTAGAEGELGCSDVPGWVESYTKTGDAAAELKKTTDSKSAKAAAKTKSQKRSTEDDGPFGDESEPLEQPGGKTDKTRPPMDDGTDDYLHHPLPESTVSKSTDKPAPQSNGDHADIQSIQEGAEIAGKVVLLSRGGCGFLEKTKWAQRRGAIALIVGDDQKGGTLIQMYARGDTSNISIPSVFTSRTTAHLLSSLVGPGSFIEDLLDENGKPALKAQHADKLRKKKHGSHPTFTPTTAATRATSTSRPVARANKKASSRTEEASTITTEKPGWFRSLFWSSKKSDIRTESSRPPSSGQLDWVLVDEWKDDDSAGSKKISTKPSKNTDSSKKADRDKKTSSKTKFGNKANSGDDFVIGVQDWRDPDLVRSPGSKDTETESGKSVTTVIDGKKDAGDKKSDSKPAKSGKKHLGGALQEIPEYVPPLRGGSITPGSGEYDTKSTANEKEKAKEDKQEATADGKSKGLLTTIFGDDEENVEFLPAGSHQDVDEDASEEEEGEGDDEDDGLWVTITPTSGASPFLDTLLVLVVSPLVTLTVVYALLLIRSRIRRRRWRAPKSVVERLPVRTYQTIASGSQSPRTPSPTSSSVTTPLLQQSPASRPRPRSRTTTGVPEAGDIVRVNTNPLQIPPIPPRAPEHEKNASESSEWKKHMGKQVECVVCLEEYIPGVSRVMSLPCGHEFHADCITPWLTTRRRTCPICKGDVVRSLARGSPSSPRYEPYHDDSDDDYQTQAAETVNTSRTSALPIPTTIDGQIGQDIEQGIISPSPTRPRRTNRPTSWRSLIVGSIGSTSRPAPSQEEDRNR